MSPATASTGGGMHVLEKLVGANGLIVGFLFVGAVVIVSNLIAKHLTNNRVHGSAIAVLLGLALAWWGGALTGGKAGLADVKLLAGVGLLGGAMFRDFTIVSTAFEVNAAEARKAGWLAPIALLLGTVIPFFVGVMVAWAFGYRDAVSLTTIGAGAVTYIVGPVTGGAIGASSDVMALSIATGVTKAILVMIYTPYLAKFMRLDNPRAAMVFGGLAGTVSGVSAGLAATDRRLVPYGALVATFHTGLGCLMGPSVLFLAVKAAVDP
jgi:malonate transporter MadM subunit